MTAALALCSPPPVVPGSLLWGVLPNLLRDPLALYAHAATLGDMVRLRLPFGQAYFLSAPELIQDVMQKRAKLFRRPPAMRRILTSLGGDNLMTREGEAYLSRRRLMQPSLQRAEVFKLSHDILRAIDSALDRWEPLAGRSICLHELLVDLTREVVARTLFGVSLQRFPELSGAFSTITRYIQYRSATPLALPRWVPTARHRQLHRALRTLDQITDEILSERRAAPDTRTDLLASLLAARDPETGTRLDDEQLRHELQMLTGAGETTTSEALTFCLSLLGRHPEVLARVVHEVDSTVGRGSVELAHVKQLSLLRQVIDESLRLYPPSYVLARAAIETTTLGDITLKPNAIVLYSPYTLHRDPRFWDSPEDFRPERFASGGEIERVPRYAYLPFGAGPRRCIGENLAQLEMVMALTRILQRFELELPSGPAPALSAGFALGIAGELLARISPRSPRHGGDRVGDVRVELEDGPR